MQSDPINTRDARGLIVFGNRDPNQAVAPNANVSGIAPNGDIAGRDRVEFSQPSSIPTGDIPMQRQFALLVFTASTLFALGAMAEDAKPIKPFNGKDLTGWLTKGGKPADTLKVGVAVLDASDPRKLVVQEGTGELINFKGHARDFYTEAKFGDALIEVEFMVPKSSNSGVYVMGEYEVQILDSFGRKKVGAGDVGGLYAAQAPRVNAALAPGKWQKFVIDFRAPKFDDNGKKTANARFVSVKLNGKVIHDNVEMSGPTPGGVSGKEQPTGPLMFQGNHGPVAYRNIKITGK